jgi:hypothetical protein
MGACLIDKMTALDSGSEAFYPNGKLKCKITRDLYFWANLMQNINSRSVYPVV